MLEMPNGRLIYIEYLLAEAAGTLGVGRLSPFTHASTLDP